MQNPQVLLDDFVAKLQSIPELENISIEGYDSESEIYRDVDDAVSNIRGVGILVIYESGGVDRGNSAALGIVHRFILVLCADSNTDTEEQMGYYTLLQNIYSGVPQPPAGDGAFALVDAQLPGLDQFSSFTHERAIYGDEEHWQIRGEASEQK